VFEVSGQGSSELFMPLYLTVNDNIL
jgi:hypothetical protein